MSCRTINNLIVDTEWSISWPTLITTSQIFSFNKPLALHKEAVCIRQGTTSLFSVIQTECYKSLKTKKKQKKSQQLQAWTAKLRHTTTSTLQKNIWCRNWWRTAIKAFIDVDGLDKMMDDSLQFILKRWRGIIQWKNRNENIMEQDIAEGTSKLTW